MTHDKQIHQLNQLIFSSSTITILTHPNPDGDALGSSLALFHALAFQNKNVKVIIPNSYPAFLKWLPGIDDTIVFDHSPKKAEEQILRSDLIICLDFNTLKRIERIAPIIRSSQAHLALIDHHLEPDSEFQIQISDTNASSTAELVYDVILSLQIMPADLSLIAPCIYVGIMTDTGSFSYSCNHPRPYEITAKLVESGLDVAVVHNLVYDTFSESRLRLLGYLLNRKMKVFPSHQAAFISLSLADQIKYNFQIGDSEGIVNYALSIEGIKLAAFFTEKSDLVRVSLRSKGDLSVNLLARQYFNGGGHKNAAGGNSYTTLKKTELAFVKMLDQIKDEIINAH